MSVESNIAELILYAEEQGLIGHEDRNYAANCMLAALEYEPSGSFVPREAVDVVALQPRRKLEQILADLLDDAMERGVIDGGVASRDLLDTKLMGCVTPRPSEVVRHFGELESTSPKAATDWFYKLALDSDYIRRYRIRKDRKWMAHTAYGDLDITINLSKPEKDPKAIAAALNKRQDAHPRCLLCPENEGYAGRLDHPARQTIRLIPLTLDGQRWYMQYSPYVYYNEHCIVLSEAHEPMCISHATFRRLLEFVTRFPHYTVGSNADLPIVGGSILTHEHFQGGCYTFAMAKAGLRQELSFPGFPDVRAGIVEWPMSVIRLNSTSPQHMVALASRILDAWRGYTDEAANIYVETDGVPHNTITPIARRRGQEYELDLVLRNNLTTEEFPLGVYHPHEELWHIKKENIGLIEVRGLAVPPARLVGEMSRLEEVILQGGDPASVPEIASHAAWAAQVVRKHPEYGPNQVSHLSQEGRDALGSVLEQEIGLVFAQVLEQCAVYPNTPEGNEGLARFIQKVMETE